MDNLVRWLNTATGVDGQPTVASLVKSITLDEAPQGALPYIVIDVTGGGRNTTQMQPLDADIERSADIQFNCHALTGQDSREVSAALESAIDRCPQFSGSTIFRAAVFNGEFSSSKVAPEGQPQGAEVTYVHQLLFTIHYYNHKVLGHV